VSYLSHDTIYPYNLPSSINCLEYSLDRSHFWFTNLVWLICFTQILYRTSNGLCFSYAFFIAWLHCERFHIQTWWCLKHFKSHILNHSQLACWLVVDHHCPFTIIVQIRQLWPWSVVFIFLTRHSSLFICHAEIYHLCICRMSTCYYSSQMYNTYLSQPLLLCWHLNWPHPFHPISLLIWWYFNFSLPKEIVEIMLR